MLNKQLPLAFVFSVFHLALPPLTFECLAEEIDKPEDDEIKTYNYQEHKPCGFMLNLATAVDRANHEVLRRGVDAVDVFCNKLNEIEIAFKRNYYKTEWLMKINKISKCDSLIDLWREQETDKYQKMKDRGRALQATLLRNIRRFATIAALHRATDGIGDVPVAFVIHTFLINISKITAFFYDEHLLAQNAEKLSTQKR